MPTARKKNQKPKVVQETKKPVDTKKKIEGKEKPTISVTNKTNQKQVLQLGEEQLVLKAYETKKLVGIDEVEAKVKFSQYIQKNVIKIN